MSFFQNLAKKVREKQDLKVKEGRDKAKEDLGKQVQSRLLLDGSGIFSWCRSLSESINARLVVTKSDKSEKYRFYFLETEEYQQYFDIDATVSDNLSLTIVVRSDARYSEFEDEDPDSPWTSSINIFPLITNKDEGMLEIIILEACENLITYTEPEKISSSYSDCSGVARCGCGCDGCSG